MITQALEGAEGSVAYVQLREQSDENNPASDDKIVQLGQELLPICKAHGAKLIVSRNVSLAKQIEADGVHLGATGTTIRAAREALGENATIGYSAHSKDEALIAVEYLADYVFLSPIFPPLSKKSTKDPLGLKALKDLCLNATCPVFALGGIAPTNVSSCKRAGASGIACISSVLHSEEPSAAARELVDAWGSIS